MRTADIRRDTRENPDPALFKPGRHWEGGHRHRRGVPGPHAGAVRPAWDFDLTIRCQGDTQVDGHHSVEDIGICLGRAFAEALGDKRGITRYGQFLLPMDETLVLVACDLSGRDYLGWSVDLPAQRVGDFDTELGKEFFLAFVRACPMSLHIRQMAGENTHHILEAVFKGAGRALKMAVAPDEKHRDEIPSTKGVL